MIDIKELAKYTKNIKLLYVEDDFEIQEKMTKYLKKLFCVVEVAQNGVIGLEKFKKEEFEIVITDISMPKMDGIDMINEMKKIKEDQVVLITTAHSESGYLMGAIHVHVDGYIIKPFNYDELNFELFRASQKIYVMHENEDYKQHLKSMLFKEREKLSDNYEKTLYTMIELIEKRDTYTAGHSKRVATYCKMIAEEMGYSKEECVMIYQAGILHDIGKIETPDAVLLNPKVLNDLEYKLIQEHVEVGYELLSSMPMFKHLAVIVRSHHERFDGDGYPDGLKGDDINYLSRIMIVADSFDAMTTSRIYKVRKKVKEALEELKQLSGKQFDPDVVKSALIVLKDVEIDNSINQLPKTKLEQERFAYFYNDTLTSAYNQDYLSLNLMQNSYENIFNGLFLFSIKDFSAYNKKYGWKAGDEFLIRFADVLFKNLEDALIFRIFGDDFAVLYSKELNMDEILSLLDSLVDSQDLQYRVKHLDLKQQKIRGLSDLEKLLN